MPDTSLVGKLSTIMDWTPAWSNLFQITISTDAPGISDPAISNPLLVKSIDISGRQLDFEYNEGARLNVLRQAAKLSPSADMQIREMDDYSVGKYFNDWFACFWKDGFYVSGVTGKKRSIIVQVPIEGSFKDFIFLGGCVLQQEPVPKYDWQNSIVIEYSVRIQADFMKMANLSGSNRRSWNPTP